MQGYNPKAQSAGRNGGGGQGGYLKGVGRETGSGKDKQRVHLRWSRFRSSPRPWPRQPPVARTWGTSPRRGPTWSCRRTGRGRRTPFRSAVDAGRENSVQLEMKIWAQQLSFSTEPVGCRNLNLLSLWCVGNRTIPGRRTSDLTSQNISRAFSFLMVWTDSNGPLIENMPCSLQDSTPFV